MKNNLEKLAKNLKLDRNIFRSAEFKLTIFYFLIICGISLIFNAVIFGTISNGRMEISQDFSDTKSTTESFRNSIIEARNAAAEKKIFKAMTILNFAILVAGGWGSAILARKTLAPLEKAHKLQSEFVSNASHEIRTPLSTIQLETELILKDKNASREDLREILQSNLEEAKSLESLTSMLLRLSKIEKIALENVNLNEIVKNRLEKFPSDKINFTESKEFIVYANETAIAELATILVDNALKYNTSKEKIDVKIFRENRQAILEVSNFSRQIEKSELDKLFERFYRSDNARSCNGKCEGHGLGLAIAKKLVENLESSLTVHNEKVAGEEEKFRTTFKVGLKFGK
ncbi:MAG: HAMP domain-containing sensor histidine kinase [Candidatus Nanogingivalis sp.]